MTLLDDTIAKRLAEGHRVMEDGCWLWHRRLHKGYGEVWINSVRAYRRAHRLMYELLVGPIPEGLDLDHLCRNRACVNPEHMEPVTNKTNVLRGQGPTAVNAAKTHCVNGHEFTDENTYSWPKENRRSCKTCERNRRAARIVREGGTA